jgi:hypothetical protein
MQRSRTGNHRGNLPDRAIVGGPKPWQQTRTYDRGLPAAGRADDRHKRLTLSHRNQDLGERLAPVEQLRVFLPEVLQSAVRGDFAGECHHAAALIDARVAPANRSLEGVDRGTKHTCAHIHPCVHVEEAERRVRARQQYRNDGKLAVVRLAF